MPPRGQLIHNQLICIFAIFIITKTMFLMSDFCLSLICSDQHDAASIKNSFDLSQAGEHYLE